MTTSRPSPFDVATSLIREYRDAAMEVARNRVTSAKTMDDIKAHDHALMVLTGVEEILNRCDNNLRRISFGDDGSMIILPGETIVALDGAKPLGVAIGGIDLMKMLQESDE